jgi:hypothetical protein
MMMRTLFCLTFNFIFLFANAQSGDSIKNNLLYINTSFENASQLDWHTDTAGVTHIGLIYDHERASPNRANGHWHFQVQAKPGSDVTVELENFENIWNGRRAFPVTDSTNCLVSEDDYNWTLVPTELTKRNTLIIKLHLTSGKLFLASVEPYRISDLEKLLIKIKPDPLVKIDTIGHTVEGRPLELIRIGNPNAPFSVFLRARAHSWEPGGNWVVEGLISSLLQPNAVPYLKRYCVYIMPMANKDGVARGRTRFNGQGADLNRQWDKPADPVLAPEKLAFEKWLDSMIAKGKKPTLAIDLHNDNNGNVHVNLPRPGNEVYTANMKRFEDLLYQRTWFREGISHVDNPSSFGEGLAKRYGIDACIYELNYEWIKGLNRPPSANEWKLLGRELREVFYHYFR